MYLPYDTDLPLLQTITLGNWALNGDSRDNQRMCFRRPYHYKNVLVMRSCDAYLKYPIDLPVLGCMRGKTFNFCYMGMMTFQSGVFGCVVRVDIPELSAEAILFQDDCFNHAVSVRFFRWLLCSLVQRIEATTLAMFVKKRIECLLFLVCFSHGEHH